jgi:hypothetical protein
VTSPVSTQDLRDFISAIEDNHLEITTSNLQDLAALAKEFVFESLSSKLSDLAFKLALVDRLNAEISQVKADIARLSVEVHVLQKSKETKELWAGISRLRTDISALQNQPPTPLRSHPLPPLPPPSRHPPPSVPVPPSGCTEFTVGESAFTVAHAMLEQTCGAFANGTCPASYQVISDISADVFALFLDFLKGWPMETTRNTVDAIAAIADEFEYTAAAARFAAFREGQVSLGDSHLKAAVNLQAEQSNSGLDSEVQTLRSRLDRGDIGGLRTAD